MKSIKSGPIVIGITGPIAAGKSGIARVLAERGAEIIDADAVYRDLITPPSPLLDTIIAHFGTRFLTPTGELDRRAMADLVFANSQALIELEQITHPAVVAEIKERITAAHAPVIVVEAVKLTESGLGDVSHAIWRVTADPEVRVRRLMARNGLDEASARARVAPAPGENEPGSMVDFTLDNSGDWAETMSAIDRAWDETVANVRS